MSNAIAQDAGTASRETIRAAVDSVFAAPDFQWRERSDLAVRLAEIFQAIIAWLNGLESSHPVAYWLLIGLTTALLVAILVHVGFVVGRALRPERPDVAPTAPEAPPPRDAEWYLQRARQLAGDGDYRSALAHRFIALLLELDAREALTFQPSKTPAEYTREARLDPEGTRTFATLVRRLYRHVFGGARCDADDLAEFERHAMALGEHVAAG